VKEAEKLEASCKPSASKMSAIKEKEEEEMEEKIPWKDVWNAMKRSGWGWRGSSGLMTDYYYIKPRCKIKDGEEGQDYFVCVEDVQKYARDTYNWGTVSHDVLMKTIEKYEMLPPFGDGTTVSVVYVSLLLIILSLLYSQNSINYRM
jgi:hypothetical protein